MFKRRERDDEIRPSTGVMKWVNRFFRFILYPFIHPKAFIILVVLLVFLLIGVPYFAFKVDFSSMPGWYKTQLNKYYNKGQDVLMPVKDKAINQYNKMLRGEVYKAANVNSKKTDDIEAYDIKPQGQRATFDGYSEENNFQQNDEVLVADNGSVGDVPATVVEIAEANVSANNEPQKSRSQVYFKHKDELGLTYIDEPEEISGRFTVINANEVLVGNREVFLYGVYTTPRSQAASEAGAYMIDNFDGKQANCHIGAYTSQNKATAICFVDGMSVNHTLVDKGWAQNISLY